MTVSLISPIFGEAVAPPPPPDAIIVLGLNCPSNGQPPNFDASKLTGFLALRDAKVNEAVNDLNEKAYKSTTITATGLAVGGGDLSQNRTINVPKASQADAQQGLDDTRALTAYSIQPIIDAIYNNFGGLSQGQLNSFVEFAQSVNNDPNFSNTVFGQITNEINARIAGDSALQGNLNAEANTRAAADSALQTNKADKLISITGTGYVSGGGDLSASRTLEVNFNLLKTDLEQHFIGNGESNLLVSSNVGNDLALGSDGKLFLKETVTAINWVEVSRTLSFLDENGNITNHIIGDTDTYSTNGSISGDIITFVDNSGTTPDISLDLSRFRITYTNNSNGTWQLTQASGGSFIIDFRASNSVFDNAGTGLTSTNVQAALAELAAQINAQQAQINAQQAQINAQQAQINAQQAQINALIQQATIIQGGA